jgi:hypothetical protein
VWTAGSCRPCSEAERVCIRQVSLGLEALLGRKAREVMNKDAILHILAQRSMADSDVDRQAYVEMWFEKDGEKLGHAVVFERLDPEEGRVYLRNSSMGRSLPAGSIIPDLSPPTRLDDPATGLLSVSLSDFRQAVGSVLT